MSKTRPAFRVPCLPPGPKKKYIINPKRGTSASRHNSSIRTLNLLFPWCIWFAVIGAHKVNNEYLANQHQVSGSVGVSLFDVTCTSRRASQSTVVLESSVSHPWWRHLYKPARKVVQDCATSPRQNHNNKKSSSCEGLEVTHCPHPLRKVMDVELPTEYDVIVVGTGTWRHHRLLFWERDRGLRGWEKAQKVWF